MGDLENSPPGPQALMSWRSHTTSQVPLNKGAAGMQLVEAGLQAMSDPISQRPNRESPAKGGCGDAACGSWPASDSASSNISAAVSQTACKRGSAGKQLVEAGLRAIGISVQQILCALRFSPASASAALSTAMRAARDRLRARTARRAQRHTRRTCAHEPRYNFNFKMNI